MSAPISIAQNGSSGGRPSEDDVAVASELGRALSRVIRMGTRIKAHVSAQNSGQRTEWSSFVVLAALDHAGPLRTSALAEAMHSDPSTVSRQAAHMVDSGLLERRQDPADGRACLLAVTPAGERLLASHRRIRDEFFADLMTDWSDRDRHRLGVLLDRLADELETKATALRATTPLNAELESE